MKQKPTIPSGTRDFGPAEVAKRNYIIDTIKTVYELYGYQPLETPVMENLSTLLGKYGEEGDKLIFKILDSGNYLKDDEAKKYVAKQFESSFYYFLNKLQNEEGEKNSLSSEGEKSFDLFIKQADKYFIFELKNAIDLSNKISEKALRYDLTVPFARYVVMHQNEITFPFKRYQIQPVWRADRPQKGRYREFYQCDADVIGSNSLLLDAELVMIIKDVFEKLKLSVTIRLNNRKILDGLNEYIGETEKNLLLVTIIDKLDKIGIDGITKELKEKEFTDDQVQKVHAVLEIKGDTASKINQLEKLLTGEQGRAGLAEIKELFEKITGIETNRINIVFDLTLARGLSYYTGTIYEVVANDMAMGSILGGGRYDNLTGIFGLPGMSGVGISFGLDRIYDVLTELNLFPESAVNRTQVLFIPFDAEAEKVCLLYAAQCRMENIRCEVYPDLQTKLGKKFKYADDKQIPYTAVIGSDEIKEGKLTLKNMQSGEQKLISVEELIAEMNNEVSGYFDVSE